MVNLSVIIPTRNRFFILRKVLLSLEKQTIPLKSFEVIVVDDGSTDIHYRFFDRLFHSFPRLNLLLLQQKHAGAAVARNQAIEKAKGRYLFFLGDDMIAHPQLLEQHLIQHKQYPNDAVLGFIDWDPKLTINSVMQFIAPYGPQFDFNVVNPMDCSFWRFYTSNLSVQSSLLETERFTTNYPGYGYEDTELGCRLAKKGMKIIYDPLAITYHYHYHDEKSFIKRQQQAGKNLAFFLKQHPEFKTQFPTRELTKRSFNYRWKRWQAKFQGNQSLYYHYTFELAWIKSYLKQLIISSL